jgi:hypothetical protein
METTTSARPRRVLVIANEACAGDALFDEIRYRSGAGGEVRVVAPALTGRMRYWASDDDAARGEAERRLAESFAECAEAGIRVDGAVGDPDPLQAIDDEVRTFAPDEIIVATHPPGRENWLERGVVGQARARVSIPVTHVVVDRPRHEAQVETPGVDPPVVERHTRRDIVLLVVAWILAIAGSLGTFAIALSDASDLALGLWLVFVDLGLKLLLMVVLWSLFLRRGRADRLRF